MSEDNKFIFPARLALKALKSTAYNNSAYALSEVVDNSYEAGARDIHIAIICEGISDNPTAIAVLDNGKGMNRDAMRSAISYGDGSHADEDPSKIKGLGRFGVGLLSATFNQCTSLEIWSWQEGCDISDTNMSAPKISLSISNINNLSNVVPEPELTPLPEFFKKVFSGFPDIENNPMTGTLVIWRDLHNLTWVKSDSLRRHLAFECGRIYRNFIAAQNKSLDIMISVWDSNYQRHSSPTKVGVVDPMFLQPWSSKNFARSKDGLGPFEGKSMFEPHGAIEGDNRLSETGDAVEEKMSVNEGDISGEIRILASCRPLAIVKLAEEEYGEGHDPGNTPYGRIAKRLEGVSILRAGREIMLDAKWLLSDQTVDRWISVSVDFDPCLDKYFGVSNNKQQANDLAELSRFSSTRQEDDMATAARNKVVLKVAARIHELLRKMRKYVKAQREGIRAGKKVPQTPEYESTARLKLLTKQVEPWSEYHPIPSDKGDPSHDTELKKGYDGSFWGGLPADKIRPPIVLSEKIRVDFVSEPNGGGAFFSVRETPSVMIIKLNRDHVMYDRLAEILDVPVDNKEHSWEIDADRAVWLIKRLLFCYARAECEAHGRKKVEFEAVRLEWGRIASVVMEDE